MMRISTRDKKTYDEGRSDLTAADFAAAGVEAPNWVEDPIPSLETWRIWRAAEDQAILHRKRLRAPS